MSYLTGAFSGSMNGLRGGTVIGTDGAGCAAAARGQAAVGRDCDTTNVARGGRKTSGAGTAGRNGSAATAAARGWWTRQRDGATGTRGGGATMAARWR